MENRLPAAETIWRWQERLNGFGPRLTGSAAHRGFIEFLQSELAALGLDVSRDKLAFTRWEAKGFGLGMQAASGPAAPLPVTSYFPYSGQTGPGGVEGEMVYYRWPPRSFARARGKIAVVEVPVPAIPGFLMSLVLRPRSRKRSAVHFYPRRFTSPLLGMAWPPNLAAAAKAGVLGVVCVWRRCSEANAAHQYLPFTKPLQQCPALWVGAESGSRLRQLARRGGRLKLRLEAEVRRDQETETLFAVLPGSDPRETIIVNTHTDGPNACEENGPIGLLALAHYFSKLPLEQRRRSLVFAFVTGHFQLPQLGSGGQATRTWLKAHPELWDGKDGHMRAVAGLTLEHLGAMEWKDDAALDFRPTGLPEIEFVYTANAALDRIYLACTAGRRIERSVTLRPMTEIYFGEGQPLFQAGIPTLSLISIPDYLCAASPGGDIDKLDGQLIHEQVSTFAKVIEAIDKAPASELGVREREPGWLLQALVRWAKPFDFTRA